MHLAWEVAQLESHDRDMLCMDMYAAILNKLFSLQLQDPQLEEMTNRIEDVVEWAQSFIYDPHIDDQDLFISEVEEFIVPERLVDRELLCFLYPNRFKEHKNKSAVELLHKICFANI